VEHELPYRRRRIDALPEEDDLHALFAQLVHQDNELAQCAPEPVQLSHQLVALMTAVDRCAFKSSRSSLRKLIYSSKNFAQPKASRSRRCISGFWSFLLMRIYSGTAGRHGVL
jgi:hypothetical protein